MPHDQLPFRRVALIGAGATGVYFLRHLSESPGLLAEVGEVWVFECEAVLGHGMPYSPRTTDVHNQCNISSAELPELPDTFADWLEAQDLAARHALGVVEDRIRDDETYSRLALGAYFTSQFRILVDRLRGAGVSVNERPGTRVLDLHICGDSGAVTLETNTGAETFDRVVIATGHAFPEEEDLPAAGHYASPWPIHRILPEDGETFNFAIGTLGASLSAFDVVSSLAQRHGRFESTDRGLVFQPDPAAPNFKVVMHSAHGWLPHLQYEQEQPIRSIYRHVSREELLTLRDDAGQISLERFYDAVCRPALVKAFGRDHRPDLAGMAADPGCALEELIEQLQSEHASGEGEDPFERMAEEMAEAQRLLRRGLPVHWKEVLDDLMYTLNFHAELLPAEDHLRFHASVAGFLMNVIAAMPLRSARTLLALRRAGRLELVAGRVSVEAHDLEAGETVVSVACGNTTSERRYRLFVDCSGQPPLQMDRYPFPTLVSAGVARAARVPFSEPAAADRVPEKHQSRVLRVDDRPMLELGGIDVDGAYRLVGEGERTFPQVVDIAFPHSTGKRPYSYGLQACSDTAAIVVASWELEARNDAPVLQSIDATSRVQETVSSDG